MDTRGNSIGIFDSGFGGLSVLKEIVRILPQYNYIYLGDTARAPYGGHSLDNVYAFTQQAVDFLFSKNCELIILACNTVSAEALRRIQQEYLLNKYGSEKRVLGVIVPTVEHIRDQNTARRIGILATEGTVESGTFTRELKKVLPEAVVFEQACPLLVPLIEAGEHQTPAAKLILKEYLTPLLEKEIDTLILGCTHYSHLAEEIAEVVGHAVSVVQEESVVAAKLGAYLSKHTEIEFNLERGGKRTFYCTDSAFKFKKLGSEFFGEVIEPLHTTI